MLLIHGSVVLCYGGPGAGRLTRRPWRCGDERGCCLSKEAGQAVSDKPCGAGQGRETSATSLWIEGPPRAEHPDSLHSVLKAPVCVPGSPGCSCQQLCQAVWVLWTDPTIHPGTLNPSLALRCSVMFVSLSCFCEIQSTHCWGPQINPETTPGHRALSPGDITAHTQMMLHSRPPCTFFPVSTLEAELPTFRGTPSCTWNTSPLLHT